MKTRGETHAPGRFIPAIHWRLGGPHRRSGHLEEEFYLLLLPRFEPQIAQPLHHSLHWLHRNCNWQYFSVSLSVLKVRTIRPYRRLDTAKERCCYSTHANVVHYTLVMGGQPLASSCHDSTDTPSAGNCQACLTSVTRDAQVTLWLAPGPPTKIIHVRS